jgi:hypothetical protein
MKRYWEVLRHPETDRWFRWIWTPLVIIGIGLNLWVGVTNSLQGRNSWLINALVFALLVLSWFSAALRWIKEDDKIRDRRAQPPTGVFRMIKTEDGEQSDAMMMGADSVPITRPEDAIDPYHYGMMRAFMDGKPFSAYIDDEGIWRDAETNEPLPVQEKGSDDDAPR